MEIKRVEVDWFEGCLNNPRFEVIVDRLPIFDGLEYDCVEHSGMHFLIAEKDGFVHYFCHSPNPSVNDGGFYGRVFRVNVKGKGMVDYVGPWSSRAGVINMIQDMQILDVVYIDVNGRFFAAITLDLIKKHLPSGVRIEKVVDARGEVIYIPVKVDE